MKFGAALAWTLFACSGPPRQVPGDGQGSDSSPTDSMVDSTIDGNDSGAGSVVPATAACDITAPPGLVKVRAVDTYQVIVHDASGAYYGRAVIGPSHVVDVLVPGCGSVTVQSQSQFRTVMHVKAGDELWMVYARGVDFGPPAMTGASIIIDAPYPGASGYYASPLNFATGPDGPIQLAWRTDQVSAQGRATILVQPTLPGFGDPLSTAYAVFDDVSLAAAVQTPLRITAWTAAPPPHHFSFQLPGVVDGWYALVTSTVNGRTFKPTYTLSDVATARPTFDMQYPEFGSGTAVRLVLASDLDPVLGYRARTWAHDFAGALPSSVNVDLTSELLPEVLTVASTTDPSRTTVSWTLGAGQVQADETLVTVTTDQGSTWFLTYPPGPTAFQVPELPSDLHQSFNNHSTVMVTLYERSDTLGYADIRGDVEGYFVPGAGTPLAPGYTYRSSSSHGRLL